ncbi:Maf family nucleotide pyrophosphatase [Sphingobacterium paludis]|uniref:dTTP/UTP pyrophosphatase n=1 Tax=Sphingobacterium paludis TaxID=1476465 RepID=A0A4R7D7W5_9SPHI|nr:Maf family nucleotide pyrophosphatase [Sphingobacterium paludis]TDS15884.1 septum formation protein [Sphingobacterium paludis]
MLIKQIDGIPVVLGSQSPRRKELLANLGIDFQVIVRETDEEFNPQQSPDDIVRSIALKKLAAFHDDLFVDSLVITADTVVVHDGQILGKPKDIDEAVATLRKLQGTAHDVLTAVAMGYQGKIHSFVERTGVCFYPIHEDEILDYVERFLPLDKAGSYGIQEWIGLIGVKALQGSYENVVGLPTARLYQELKVIIASA